MPVNDPRAVAAAAEAAERERNRQRAGAAGVGVPAGVQVGNATAAAATGTGVQLHSRGETVKFAMYWPRKSKYPDWWKEMKLGTISWADVDADLDQMKATLGINAVRVFTYYDHEYRQSGGASMGWTDGQGTFNGQYLGYLSTFIDKCKARGLDVIVTMFQILPALKTTDDWTFLERDIAHYKNFLQWMLEMLDGKSNVHFYNLMNEPDGYGVWANVPLATRVLTWLSALKDHGKKVAPRLEAMISATTHDNNFRRLPVPYPGYTSLYELTDVLALNTFLWADTGFWSGQNYRTQTDYVQAQNVLSKPIVMTECGFPVGYAQQAVAGSPKVDENGVATGGNATVTDDSIVPQGGIFDRPKGVGTGVPQTEANQARSIAEAAYWAWKWNLDGLGVWSAFDHANPALSFVYRDPFGVIDKNGVPRSSAAVFAAALTERFDANGEWRISLSQGTVSALPSRINGLGGYNAATPDQNTVGGVYLHSGGGSWTSDALVVGVPMKLRVDFTLRVANTASEPFIFRLLASGRTFDWRYKVYDKSAFQAIDATATGDVSGGWAQSTPFTPGQHSLILDLTAGFAPQITHNGTPLTFTGGAPLELLAYQALPLKLQLLNNGNSPIDITRLTALGPAGQPVPLVPRKKPTR